MGNGSSQRLTAPYILYYNTIIYLDFFTRTNFFYFSIHYIKIYIVAIVLS